MSARIPVERLQPGDQVKAVEHGPTGRVINDQYGWVVVQYPSGAAMQYEHGVDRLILLSEAGR